ncbi:hypothetical protein B0H14DRAFT_2698570 [Mycena olivaceomarginata]|nr:hypothetical protein B0H14DRAFT_2698570 [Mycena olivaceomarginata]
MQFSAFLFNPIIRVYTSELCFSLFANQKLIAVVDLFFNISEIIYAIVLIVLNRPSDVLEIIDAIGLDVTPDDLSLPEPYPKPYPEELILILLTATATFRIATFRASPDRFWRQKFAFLSGCPPANPPYTPWRILLNRSLARPLVSFGGIILLRALILSGIVLGFPVFAVYSIIYSPLRTHIRSDTFTDRLGQPWEIVYPTEGAIIVIVQRFHSKCQASDWDNIAVACPSVFDKCCWDFVCFYQVVKCPVRWDQTINITVSLSFFPQNAPSPIYVLPGQGEYKRCPSHSPIAFRRIISKPSSLLSAPFNVTYLIQISRRLKLTYHQPWRTVAAHGSQHIVKYHHLEASEPFSSTVTLVPQWIQESTATPLDGISKVGGLWTLLKVYSSYFSDADHSTALGIVHTFPALHDEGGRPGDTSAGIVAFIRERLGQDGKDATTDDLEAQKGEQNSENQADWRRPSNPVHNESSAPFSGLNPSRRYLIQAGYPTR